MPALRTRNGAVLFKLEASEGVPETLSAATDAVLVENPTINYNPQNTDTNEVTGSLDNRGPIVGGMQVAMQFDVYMKGSGTPGAVPEVGNLLRACGWAEVLTASPIPGAAEAAAAGTTTSVTLGASFAATAQLYRGMPLDLTVNPAAGARSFIADYSPDGASKVATLFDLFGAALDITTLCQIPANVLYKPSSATIPTGTLEMFKDGLKHKVAGVRGTMTLTLEAAKPAKFSFQLSGMYVGKTDEAVPGATYDATRPPVWRGGKSLIDRASAVCATLSLNNGNNVVYPENPTAAEGFDPAVITERGMTGSIDPQATLVATRDILADMRNGNAKTIHASYGTVDGNKVALSIPTALYTGNDPGDRSGIMTEETPFSAIGQDAGAFICFH